MHPLKYVFWAKMLSVAAFIILLYELIVLADYTHPVYWGGPIWFEKNGYSWFAFFLILPGFIASLIGMSLVFLLLNIRTTFRHSLARSTVLINAANIGLFLFLYYVFSFSITDI
jgi:hypothetical protein